MNFIEKLFGVSPDGGSGLLEWPLLLTLAFMAIALLHVAAHSLEKTPATA